MTCEATWMVASFQSTISPFIQILPVPANAMGDYMTLVGSRGSRVQTFKGRKPAVNCLNPLNGLNRRRNRGLLPFRAEWADVGAGGEGLAALPAELRLHAF